MDKATLGVVILFALSLLMALGPLFYALYHPALRSSFYVEEHVFSYETTITYYNRGNETWELSDADVAFPLFFNGEGQRVELVWSSRPVAVEAVDVDGNSWAILYVSDRKLEPGEYLSLSVRYEIAVVDRSPPAISVELSGTLEDIPDDLRQEFCGQAACWQTYDEELRSLAQNLSRGKENVLEILSSFISWIHDNVEYETYELPRYPNETYSGRKGDCDDQANLLITLCRIVGIPAYLRIGCIYIYYEHPIVFSGSMWSGHVIYTARNVAWHGWAQVYVPPWGWLPVDLTASVGVGKDPLNAVRNAIWWAWITVLCEEVKFSDYIAEARRAREMLVEKGIYVYEREDMEFLEERQVEKPEAVEEARTSLLFYLMLTVAVVGASTASVAIIVGRGREEAPTPRQPRTPHTTHNTA